MAEYERLTPPHEGQRVRIGEDGRLEVPDEPIIPWIEGDGIGPDIWVGARHVLDGAVSRAYQGKRRIVWFEIFAGEKAWRHYGEEVYLPEDTFRAIEDFAVAIKGPLTTPVGGGPRSLNVTLRQKLDLYASVRPVRYFQGVPSAVWEPEKLDVVIFRENTEDVYAGIELPMGSAGAGRVIGFLKKEMGVEVRPSSGVAINPISKGGTRRLVRRAIDYALDRGRRSVTLVHQGNIMKYTEGAFCQWGYQLAREEFADRVISEEEVYEKHGGKLPEGKILIKDRIADSMFQRLLLRPDEYEVLATPNLNGDYLSDACAAQVGGLGMVPEANIGDRAALFEATHGTRPRYTGQDKVNPSSLILSGAMMLEHLGWREAADLVYQGIQGAISAGTVTYDLERQMEGVTKVRCSEFGKAIVEHMAQE